MLFLRKRDLLTVIFFAITVRCIFSCLNFRQWRVWMLWKGRQRVTRACDRSTLTADQLSAKKALSANILRIQIKSSGLCFKVNWLICSQSNYIQRIIPYWKRHNAIICEEYARTNVSILWNFCSKLRHCWGRAESAPETVTQNLVLSIAPQKLY